MKILKNTLVLILAIGLIFSCSKSHKENHDEHMHADGQEASYDHAMESSVSESETTQAYLDLKNALVETDATTAGKAAKSLASAFHTAEFHEEASLAEEISASNDVEEQRATFKILSEKVYALASEQKIEFNTLYKQYCPMAFDNTGAYWLSDSKEIYNPYFGDKMLKCGRVEETLAKK